jgi:tRNA(fMet)-specific endonuclease VapC
MRFLLDTNIISDLVRNPSGPVAERISQIGERNVCTSVIVAAELRYGVEKKRSPRLAAQVAAVLQALKIIPFEPPADQIYGRVRAQLERDGRIIGGNDLLIAAHALSLGMVLVTDNESEFSLVEGLRWENWMRGARF